VSQQAFGVDVGPDQKHRAGWMGFAGWRAEIEIEGTLDGFAVLREIVGTQRGFEGG